MSYLDWHVGMKVVCIASPESIATGRARIPGSVFPEPNGIYTIREIRDDAQWCKGKSRIVLLLVEIDNGHFVGKAPTPGKYGYVEPGFPINGFRPVQNRKTDISIFTAMLTGSRQEVSA